MQADKFCEVPKKKTKQKERKEKQEWVKKMKKHDVKWHGDWHVDLLMLSYGMQIPLLKIRKNNDVILSKKRYKRVATGREVFAVHGKFQRMSSSTCQQK